MLVVTGTGERTVSAQGVTTISIEPGESNLPLGAVAEIKIKIANGVDLNAYDLRIMYDAEVLTLESWSHGGFLSNVSVVYRQETPGLLQLAVTQLASEGVSGDGILLNLKFMAAAQGGATITIEEAQLATKANERILPRVMPGTVFVTEQQSLSPTSTAPATATDTKTATATFTYIPTSMLTPTITQTRTLYSLINLTPTRTRTPTAMMGKTITPIRSSVVTGTPGTTVVVELDPQLKTTPSLPKVTAQAGKSGDVGTIATPAVGIETPTAEEMMLSTSLASSSLIPGEEPRDLKDMNGAITGLLKWINIANNIFWGVGLLKMVVLTGLVAITLTIWKKM